MIDTYAAYAKRLEKEVLGGKVDQEKSA